MYKAGGAGGGLRLTWFDRSGKPTGTLGEAGDFGNIEFSPDRRSLAARVVDQTGNSDIWIYNVTRALGTRFTFDPAVELEGIWSPDGRSIVFNSNRKGNFDLYRKSSNGVGAEQLLYADKSSNYIQPLIQPWGLIFGFCRWRAIRSRFHSFAPPSTNSTDSSRRMGNGWPTNPTSRGTMRFTLFHFPAQPASSRFLRAEAASRAGGEMARRSSILAAISG